MGAAPSSVRTNEELVEYLVVNGYLHKKEVELVFRAVDRGDYVLPSHDERAYSDVAWKHGNLHLSAPCVYAAAMEYLCLKPGQSFLNIGSGTGYFSTMAGLLLGTYGTNHGIEIHEDCVQYARERLEDFKEKSNALEEFEFCEPHFAHGNCLRVEPTREYDTVYCGAAVSENNLPAVKRFVRVGGSIVMPYRGRLCCFKRMSEGVWGIKTCLGVSFTMLVTPIPSDQSSLTLPESEPLSLQELCRSMVRQILRKNICIEHPELEKRNLSHLDRESNSESSFERSESFSFGEYSDEEEYEEEEDDYEDEYDDDEEEEDDEDEDLDYETADHIIRRTQFLFNMEVDSDEVTRNPLQLRRVAMLVQQRIGADLERAGAWLDGIRDDGRNVEPVEAVEAQSSLERENVSANGQSSNTDQDRMLEEESRDWIDANQGNSAKEEKNSEGDREKPDDDDWTKWKLDEEPEDWIDTNQGNSAKEENNREDDREKLDNYDWSEWKLDEESKDWIDTNQGNSAKEEKNRDSDSEREEEEENIMQWKKMGKRENTDSGIVDDVNVNFENQSDSETTDDMDVNLSSIALSESFRRVCENRSKNLTPSQSLKEAPPDDTDAFHSRLFIRCMREKIRLLPLPDKMKLYINHNRSL